MKRAIIFTNGRLDETPAITKKLLPTDLIIAVDGGTLHCRSLGIKPDIIIGDFDSLDTHEVTVYRQAGVEMIQYPSHKNETDLELALQLALKRSVSEVFIIAALGARWDMSIANILLMTHPMFSGLIIHLMDGIQEFRILRSAEQVDLYGQPGDIISLIPLAGDAQGITTRGLEYPLNNETLYFGSPRGISNVFIQNHACIELRQGILLCILNWVENDRVFAEQ